MEIVRFRINNRQELYKWVKENCTLFDKNCLVDSIQDSFDFPYSIYITGKLSGKRVTKHIVFSPYYEVYPFEFQLFKHPFDVEVMTPYPYGSSLPWLVEILCREFLGRKVDSQGSSQIKEYVYEKDL